MAVIIILFILLTLFSINFFILISTNKQIHTEVSDVNTSFTALVLGAKVYTSGIPSHILQDRLMKALELYEAGKVKRILLSGDPEAVEYDEVRAMKRYLLDRGVPGEDLFLDNAGFDTYDSVVRAKEVFNVDELIIVTQDFHLPRAVYIAQSIGLKAQGYKADRRRYQKNRYYHFREFFARLKAFWEVTTSADPRILGDVIDIKGNSKDSWD